MSAQVEPMDDRTFHSYAHPKQKRRFCLALVFATLLFPLMALALVAGTVFLIVPLFALLLWVAMRTYFARLIGNMVLVSEINYPRIHAITEEMKQKLGYSKRVYVFVHESEQFNTFLAQRFFRRAIFLNSEIVENGVSDDEVRWLVGRFVGYLRARKQAGALGVLIRAAQRLLIFNLFLLPYERVMVSTGDRLALAAIGGDVSSAVSALQKLLVGRQQGYSLNPEGVIDQHRQIKGTFFGFLARAASGYPHMTMRYVDLIAFAKVCFPSHYARFLAANPAMPDDLAQLAGLPERVTEAGPGVQSGNTAGWITCAATLGAVAIGAIAIAGLQRTQSAALLASYESEPLGTQSSDPAPMFDTFNSTQALPAEIATATAPVEASDEEPSYDWGINNGLVSDSSAIESRDAEAFQAGYEVDQQWSELTVPRGHEAYVEVDAQLGVNYLVLARAAPGCDVNAIVSDSVRDESPEPDAGVQFGVSEPGTIRVRLPVQSGDDSCLVGLGVYRAAEGPTYAAD